MKDVLFGNERLKGSGTQGTLFRPIGAEHRHTGELNSHFR